MKPQRSIGCRVLHCGDRREQATCDSGIYRTVVVRLSTQTDGGHDAACCHQVPHSNVRVGQSFVRTVQPGGRTPLHWPSDRSKTCCHRRNTPAVIADSRSGRVLRVSLLFLFSVACWGATLRLYLTDGTYQWAREYQVLQDRVRYYSSERDEWEEIPLTMIDLHRTQMEASRSNAGLMSRATNWIRWPMRKSWLERPGTDTSSGSRIGWTCSTPRDRPY